MNNLTIIAKDFDGHGGGQADFYLDGVRLAVCGLDVSLANRAVPRVQLDLECTVTTLAHGSPPPVPADLAEAKQNYEGACKTIALMHEAASGVTGCAPKRGVVEDVADLRARCIAAEEALAAARRAAAPMVATGTPAPSWTSEDIEKVIATGIDAGYLNPDEMLSESSLSMLPPWQRTVYVAGYTSGQMKRRGERIEKEALSSPAAALRRAGHDTLAWLFDVVDSFNGKPIALSTPSVRLDTAVAEEAWGIIASVSGGDWTKQSREWVTAAERWRDNYMPAVAAVAAARAKGDPVTPQMQAAAAAVTPPIKKQWNHGDRPKCPHPQGTACGCTNDIIIRRGEYDGSFGKYCPPPQGIAPEWEHALYSTGHATGNRKFQQEIIAAGSAYWLMHPGTRDALADIGRAKTGPGPGGLHWYHYNDAPVVTDVQYPRENAPRLCHGIALSRPSWTEHKTADGKPLL